MLIVSLRYLWQLRSIKVYLLSARSTNIFYKVLTCNCLPYTRILKIKDKAAPVRSLREK